MMMTMMVVVVVIEFDRCEKSRIELQNDLNHRDLEVFSSVVHELPLTAKQLQQVTNATKRVVEHANVQTYCWREGRL
eukprot:748504-Hanusia_phi.AAC.5